MATKPLVTLRGLPSCYAAFKAMPEAFRDSLNDATELTVREIVRNAKARIVASPSIQTRGLLNHIAWSMNYKNGRGRAGVSSGSTVITVGTKKLRVKGLVIAGPGGGAGGGRLDMPSKRAHFVEFGTRHMPAEPFMRPAAEGQRMAYIHRCEAAGRRTEQTLAHVGSRFL